jgi:hypothetical protein
VKRVKALAKYETSRNLGDELLAAAREIKAGKAAPVHNIKVPEILEVRTRTAFRSRGSPMFWASLPSHFRGENRDVVNPKVPRVHY